MHRLPAVCFPRIVARLTRASSPTLVDLEMWLSSSLFTAAITHDDRHRHKLSPSMNCSVFFDIFDGSHH